MEPNSNTHILHQAFNELITSDKCSFHPMMAIPNLPLNNRNGVIAPSIWKEVKEEVTKPKAKSEDNTPFSDLDFVLIGPKIGFIIFMVRSSSYGKDLKRGSKIDLPPKSQSLREDLENFQESTKGLELLLEKSTNLKIDAALPIQRVIILDNVEKSRFDQLTDKAKARFAGLKVWFKDDLKNAPSDESNGPLFSTLYGFLSEASDKVAGLNQCQKDSMRAIYETYVPLLANMNSISIGITEETMRRMIAYLVDEEKAKKSLVAGEAQLDSKASSPEDIGITEEELRKLTLCSDEEKTKKSLLKAILIAEAKVNPRACSTRGSRSEDTNSYYHRTRLDPPLFLASDDEVVLNANRRIFVFGGVGEGKTITLLIKMLLLIEQKIDEETENRPLRPIPIMMPQSIRGKYDAFLRQFGFEMTRNYKICDEEFFLAYFTAIDKMLPILCKFGIDERNHGAIFAFIMQFMSEKHARENYAREFGAKNTADIILDALCSLIGKDLTPSTRANLKAILDSIDGATFSKVLREPSELSAYLQSLRVGDKFLDAFESEAELEHVFDALKIPRDVVVSRRMIGGFLLAPIFGCQVEDMEHYIGKTYEEFLEFKPYLRRMMADNQLDGNSALEVLREFLKDALTSPEVFQQLKTVLPWTRG